MARFVSVPVDDVAAVRERLVRLPEVTVEDNSGGLALKVRRRTFGRLLAVLDPDDRQAVLLTFRVEEDEREALLGGGHPFFPLRADRAGAWVGMVVDSGTDWDEVGELLLDSYCQVAPKALAAEASTTYFL